jgi:hypothetical protein
MQVIDAMSGEIISSGLSISEATAIMESKGGKKNCYMIADEPKSIEPVKKAEPTTPVFTGEFLF